jgi:hypothetical protein
MKLEKWNLWVHDMMMQANNEPWSLGLSASSTLTTSVAKTQHRANLALRMLEIFDLLGPTSRLCLLAENPRILRRYELAMDRAILGIGACLLEKIFL